MGADFLEKTKKPFRKHLDRSRAKLKSDTLFSVDPELRGRILRAEVLNNASPSIGECLAVELDNGRLIARRGITPVAVISDPPQTVVRHLSTSDSLAKAEVSEINPFCGTLGIKLDALQ